MSYFATSEKLIFLHFLNREAFVAGNSRRTEDQDLDALDVLTICHCSNMTVNISQMVEYTHDKPKLIRPLSRLVEQEVIITTSRDKDLEDFVESRRRMYHQVADYYPMYFSDTSVLRDFSIRMKNSFSMSRLLRRDLGDIQPHEFNLGGYLHQEDWDIVVKSSTAANRVFVENVDWAVTRKSLEQSSSQSFTDRELAAFARYFSARYFEHYRHHHTAVTCSGLGDVGFVDQTQFFPHYDVPILRTVLSALGWPRLKQECPDLREQVVSIYASAPHRRFVAALNSFILACSEVQAKTINVDRNQPEFFSSLRPTLSIYAASAIDDGRRQYRMDFSSAEKFYESARLMLEGVAAQISDKHLEFKQCWERNMASVETIRILVLTATDTEDDAIIDALEASGFKRFAPARTKQGIGVRYLQGAANEIIRFRTSAGSVGQSGSELVTAEAINELDPHFIIASGICFGLKKDKQKMGDVLISEKVSDYELVRLSDEDFRERGPRTSSNSTLLDAARIVREDYRTGDVGVMHGEFISGLKLLDSLPEVEQLQARFPDAIGGEMEASGVVAASARHQKGWIVIKAVCDWGFGKGDDYQKTAADNAATYAIKVAQVVFDAQRTGS